MTTGRTTASRPEIVALDAAAYVAAIPGLAALVVDAVDGGASVNFMAGVTAQEAAAWWTARIPDIADGTITVLVAVSAAGAARLDEPDPDARGAPVGGILGSTILIRSRNANSPHRAEIGKVLVHRAARRRGLGSALMRAVEERARADGRWLLILDTEARTAADAFYRSLGWTELGTMPNHAYRSDGALAPTTYFWKDLRQRDP